MSKQSLIDRFLAVLAEEEKAEDTVPVPAKHQQPKSQKARNKKKQAIVDYVSVHQNVKSGPIRTKLKIAQSTAGKLLAELVEEGALVKDNGGANTTYRTPMGAVPTKDVAPVAKKRTIGQPTTEESAQTADAILEYASKNMGKRYSVHRMGQDLQIANGNVYYYVNQLTKRGLLPKGFNQGTELLVPASNQVTAEAAPVLATVDKPKDELLQKIDFLVWDYVKATRSTDVLGFLTYLETKCK